MQGALDAFHSINDMRLRNVIQVYEYDTLAILVLEFDTASLFLTAVANDDSLDVSTTEPEHKSSLKFEGANEVKVWSDVLGKRFGWGWVTVNQQGYRDGALLSFEGIVPQIFVKVIASTLKFGTVQMTPTLK